MRFIIFLVFIVPQEHLAILYSIHVYMIMTDHSLQLHVHAADGAKVGEGVVKIGM